ncbi:MAG: hypothetical protein ACYDHH_20125 [Solirubrobacteraceae bacterium]
MLRTVVVGGVHRSAYLCDFFLDVARLASGEDRILDAEAPVVDVLA